MRGQRAIACRTAMLLGGTAVMALAITQPANAIVVNDQTATAAGGIGNYYDQNNQFPNVVSLYSTSASGSQCTGTLINSRTILTAAHCFVPNSFGIPSISFNPISGAGVSITSFVRNPDFVPAGPNTNPSITNDIAVISLAQPVTNIAPVKLLQVQPGQPGFPTVGTTITMVGYGLQGTGSGPAVAVAWHPDPGTQNPPPITTTIADNKRRVGTSSLGLYGQLPYAQDVDQPFFASQFRNPRSPSAPNAFGLTVPTTPLEAGTASGDSGGPLFAMINGQLTQIGVVRGGMGQTTRYCAGPGGPDDPVVCPDQNNPVGQTGLLERFGYGNFSDWTPINLFLQWIQENNPLRQVTAAAGNFNWSNQAAWIDAFPDPANPNGAVPNNTGGPVNFSANEAARYYQVTLSNPGTVTVDMSPTIDTLAISGTNSRLIVPTSFTLTTVLSTTLSAGTLAMRGGTLSSPELLISGGSLIGEGTINSAGGNTGLCATGVCNTGGIVEPDGGILAIAGNYTQTGGTLAYVLSPAGPTGTLAVQGTGTSGIANLGGTLAVTVTPGLYANATPYRNVLTANVVNGQFAQVTSSSVFLPAMATYNASSVDLTLNRIPFGGVPGLSGNQRAVGNALESSYSTSLTGQQALFYGNILASPTTNVLTQLSGESNAGAGQIAAFQLTNQFLLLMLNPFGQDRGGFGAGASGPAGGLISRFAPEREAAPEIARAYAAVTPDGRAATYSTPRWNVWASAFGGASNTNGDPGGAGTHSFAARTGGIAAGLDYKVTPDTLIGFALAGGDTSWGLAQGLGGGHSDAFQAGLYGSQLFGPAYLSGALAFANYWTATSRGVMVASIDTLNASFDAQSFAGRAEAGYKLAWAPANITPYVAVQAQSFRTPNFNEASSSGSTLYSLNYASHTGSATRAELGSWLSNNYLLAGNAEAVVFGRVAWAHDWQEGLQAAATFLTVPTASFIVNGAKPASNIAVVTAGTELRLAQGVSLMGKFDGEFGQGTQTYAGTARVRYTW
ncbi:MAG: autotransporter domain-containing protein [Xanthobacteraceae bacterium]|nr:autotransporter domain-containing protein [Xanthobacteraceae bacterium]